MAAELLWLALLAPAFLFPSPLLTPALLALPALWLVRRRAGGHFVPRTPLDVPIVGMLAMVLVSLFATFDIGFSLGKVAGVLFGIAVYYALVAWADSGPRLRRAACGYALAGGAMALVSLLGTQWDAKFTVLNAIGAYLPAALRGVPGAENGFHPNEVGGALLWVLPVQVALLAAPTAVAGDSNHGRRLLRAGLALAMLLSASTLVLTQSRTALIGLACGGLLAAALTWPRLRPVLAGALVVGTLGVALLGPGRLAHALLDVGAVSTPDTSTIATLQGRAEIWTQAVYGIEDFPLTGMGMNAFRQVRLVMYPTADPAINIDLGHAHNQLLQAALDLGLPGLAAYLAIWLIAAALVAYAWRRPAALGLRPLVVGLAAGLLAAFVYGLTDAVALGAKPGVFFWALLALLVSAGRIDREPAAQNR